MQKGSHQRDRGGCRQRAGRGQGLEQGAAGCGGGLPGRNEEMNIGVESKSSLLQ